MTNIAARFESVITVFNILPSLSFWNFVLTGEFSRELKKFLSIIGAAQTSSTAARRPIE
jgi:hypothetical protein